MKVESIIGFEDIRAKFKITSKELFQAAIEGDVHLFIPVTKESAFSFLCKLNVIGDEITPKMIAMVNKQSEIEALVLSKADCENLSEKIISEIQYFSRALIATESGDYQIRTAEEFYKEAKLKLVKNSSIKNANDVFPTDEFGNVNIQDLWKKHDIKNQVDVIELTSALVKQPEEKVNGFSVDANWKTFQSTIGDTVHGLGKLQKSEIDKNDPNPQIKGYALEKIKIDKHSLFALEEQVLKVWGERLNSEERTLLLKVEEVVKAGIEEVKMEVKTEMGNLERERLQKERIEKEQAEKERVQAEKLERERLEKERVQAEKLERERLEKERLDREKAVKAEAKKKQVKKENPKKDHVPTGIDDEKLISATKLAKEYVNEIFSEVIHKYSPPPELYDLATIAIYIFVEFKEKPYNSKKLNKRAKPFFQVFNIKQEVHLVSVITSNHLVKDTNATPIDISTLQGSLVVTPWKATSLHQILVVWAKIIKENIGTIGQKSIFNSSVKDSLEKELMDDLLIPTEPTKEFIKMFRRA